MQRGLRVGSASLPLLPKQTYETVGRYLDSCRDGMPRSPPTPLPRPEDSLITENSYAQRGSEAPGRDYALGHHRFGEV